MQENTTFFDDTRYDNLNSLIDAGVIKSDTLSAKPAKLSALQNFRNNENKIKQELKTKTEVKEEVSMEVPTPTEMSEPAPVAEEPKIPEPIEETQQFPTKEALEAKTKGITFYNALERSTSDTLGRKLRVAPQVKDSMQYATNNLGIEYVKEESELSEEEINNHLEENPQEYDSQPEQNLKESIQQENVAYDFGALPGVGDNDNQVEAYEENIHTEQDDRLNDYLNRENNVDNNSANFDELEEIRKLKREIEEARESLLQVKANVGDLQQKDNAISEQLAEYKRSLMQERDAINSELVDQTREWNDLTQLVKQKEELIGEEESFGMNRVG